MSMIVQSRQQHFSAEQRCRLLDACAGRGSPISDLFRVGMLRVSTAVHWIYDCSLHDMGCCTSSSSQDVCHLDCTRFSDTGCRALWIGRRWSGSVAPLSRCSAVPRPHPVTACVRHGHTVSGKGAAKTVTLSSQAYAQAMNLMQKLLGLKPKLTARDLCIQFGCAPVHLLCGEVQPPAVTQQAPLQW